MTKELKNKILKWSLILCIAVFVFVFVWFGYFSPMRAFKKNEEIFFQAGKKYFEVNQNSLPKDENRILSVSMETLVKQKYLDRELTISNGTVDCDIKKSTVRAKNTKNGQKYYTYLKCASFESDIDHEGPTIEMNGEENMVISRGSNYQDAGIKSVKDNIDGVISTSSVITKGSVDTNKVGVYTISYTAKDSLDNKTTVERTVEVIEKLSDTIKKATEQTGNIYVGSSLENYVLFNNMLFRIVKVNENGTVLIVSNDSLANVDYSDKNGRFAGSSLDQWLNQYFYNLLEEDYQKMIMENKWCDDIVPKSNLKKETCDRYSDERKVGILSIQDYISTLDSYNKSYLSSSALTWYSNFSDEKLPYTLIEGSTLENTIYEMETDKIFNVKPALVLKNNTRIVSGTGTKTDPYILKTKEKVKRNSKINTRQIGEYVRYSSYLFRISGIKDNTTEITMVDILASDGVIEEINYKNTSIYDPKNKNSIGYKINQNMTKYMDTSLLKNQEIEVPIYKDKVVYNGNKEVKKYKVRLSAPSTFTIFSAKSNDTTTNAYWLLESSKNNNRRYLVYYSGTVPYLDELDPQIKAAVKIRAYFDDNIIIKEGQGTIESPFVVSK